MTYEALEVNIENVLKSYATSILFNLEHSTDNKITSDTMKNLTKQAVVKMVELHTQFEHEYSELS